MSKYDLLNYIGAAALLIYNLLNIKERRKLAGGRLRTWAMKQRSDGKGGTLFRDNLWLVIEIIIISIFQYAPAPMFNMPFGKLVGTGANYFGLLYTVPFILFIGCLIIKVEPLKQIDLLVPAFPLALVFVKLGCFEAGCCGGIAWDFGIPNVFTGCREFPVQLLEAGIAFVIFLLLLKTRKRMKEGTVFPIYLMTYSGIRFFSEFLRGEEAVMWGLKRYHYLCLIGLALGIIEYYVVVNVREKINSKLINSEITVE